MVGASLAVSSMALGVLFLAFANSASRVGASGAQALFWAGLAAILLPAMWRIARGRTSRRERLLLVLSIGAAIYLAKIAHSPIAFDFHDEFAHSRTTMNLLLSGHLFDFNSLLPPSVYYPGLALVTGTWSRLSGLPLFYSGLVVIGAARFTMAAALFLLLERLTGSSRAAGLGALVYAGNPNFLYWPSMFAYESLALPLAMVASYLLVRRGQQPRGVRLTMVAVVVILAVVVTHHLTAFALTVLLVVWTIAAGLRRRRGHLDEYVPMVPATAAVVSTALWVSLVAPITNGYLSPVLTRAMSQGYDLLARFQTTRVPFSQPGQTAALPLWERAAAIAAVVTILILLPFAIREVVRKPLPLLAKILAWSTLLWVVMLPLRLTVGGQETANRSSEFVYLGIGLALGVVLTAWLRRGRLVGRLAVFVVVVLVFMGGIAVSWDFRQRLALNHNDGHTPLSTTPDERAAARWFLAEYGPEQRVATDLATNIVFGSVGRQHVLRAIGDGAQVWRIFYPTSLTPGVYAEIRRSRVQYIVLQRRLTLGPPLGWPLFDSGDPPDLYMRPVAREALDKFSTSPDFQLVYRSAEVEIYAVAPSLWSAGK